MLLVIFGAESSGNECSVQDVLIFLSGSSRVPPTGFNPRPSVMFVHDQHRPLATASTCELQIRLPLCHGSYATFKDAMILSMKSNDGFGGP